MRICLIVHDFDLRCGHGRYAVELARRLSPEHSVHVLASTFAEPLREGWTYERVRSLRTTNLSTVFTFAWQAEALVRRRAFDIVHAQGWVCRQADVVTAHMCNAAKRRLLPPRTLKAQLFPLLVTPAERIFFQECGGHLISVSRAVDQEIRQHYGWHRASDVIYHGTDAGVFHPASPDQRLEERRRYGVPPDAWLWLFMGEAVKGLEECLLALTHFPKAQLLVISRSQPAPWLARASALGVESQVHFQGFESQPERAFRAADLFLYPSRYDPFGLVVSEAMATGLPVICGAGIGAAEWIRHGENGMHCQPDKPENIRHSLTWLERHPAEAKLIGERARETVLNYTWDRCYQETLQVYQKVAATKAVRLKAKE